MLAALPMILLVVRKIEMREDAKDELLDDVINGFGRVVKGGSGGHDECAGVVEAQHVFNVDAVERRFAKAEDEFAALLETNVGGAGEQIVAHAGGNRAERARGARYDDHGVHGGAAGGDGRADVAIGKNFELFRGRAGEKRSEFFCVGGDDAEFSGNEAQAGVACDNVNVRDARISVEDAENCLCIDCAARAGDAYGDGFAFALGHCGEPNL